VSLVAIPVLLFVGATASCVGYAIAHLNRNEQITPQISAALILGSFVLSPINYPGSSDCHARFS